MKVIIIENQYPKLITINGNLGYIQNFNHQIPLDSTKSFNAPSYKCFY